MRIVFYHPRAVVGDGGITNAVRRLSTELARSGIDVVVVFDGTQSWSEGRLRWEAVRHQRLGTMRVPDGLNEKLTNDDVLVLQSGWSLHNVRAASTAHARGIPFVLAPRGAYDPMIVRRHVGLKRAWFMAFERNLLRRTRATHIFFDDERRHLDSLGYRGDFIVAPNGVDAPPGVTWDGGSGGYVLWLGRFDPEHKGLDLLIDALALVPANRRPQIRMHGPDWRGRKRRVHEMVSARGLDRYVSIGGPVYGQEKWSLFERATGFVYPSRWEAFGNATAEAASIGVPSLVTPYPLGRYLAARGGAILSEATPPALAGGLASLTADSARLVGRAGAHTMRTEMTWAAAAKTWRTQLEALV